MRYDLVVVGGGVNGMVCALLAQEKGIQVLLIEGYQSLGGGVRTLDLTLPGFKHDMCSAVHPFGRCSPVLRGLNLEAEGLEWVDPEVPVAHPLLGEEAVLLYRSVEQTALEMGSMGKVYRLLMNQMVKDWDLLEDQLLGPALRVPNACSLFPLARFGPLALSPSNLLGKLFGKRGAALWAGLAAHSFLPLESLSSSAVACVLGLLAHKVGWPMPRGGAQQISLALEKKLRRAGVHIEVERRLTRLSDLPAHRALVLDLSAHQIESLMGPLLPHTLRMKLRRFQLGPGVFKVDYALSEPVPWTDPRVSRAGTIHVGGEPAALARSERAVWQGEVASEPFLLAVQPSLFDPTRAPVGKHTFWVYLHTPNAWPGDALDILERQMERFAPGFREIVLQRSVSNNARFEHYNPNYVGGDIMGGASMLSQLLARPRLALDPYHLGGSTFCCSASVPPGGGIHGMGGYHAFQSLWSRCFN